MRAACLLLTATLSTVACGGATAPADGTGDWVGSVSTESAVTTVRNESGSKWGGLATLVEEASIGVDVGPPEYMLGSPGGLFATDNEVYVIDPQVPAVRVYDWQGQHLRNIGNEGQGPGEYLRPSGVLVDPAGRIYVREGGGDRRINVYSSSGEPLETWRWSTGTVRISGGQLLMRHDGAIFTRAIRYPEGEALNFENRVRGMQQVGREGAVGEMIEEPDLGVETMEVSSDRMTTVVPFSPGQVTSFTPAGAYLVGDNSDYSFEIRYPDDRVITVERFWTPVPISDAEADYSIRTLTSSMRRINSLPEWSYNGSAVPDHKPAYYSFYPTQGTRVMVVRHGPSHMLEGCDLAFDLNTRPEGPCFEFERVWDMFDLEGNYLGEVQRPDAARLSTPFWRDDALWIVVEDELGTMMVKRFRFELPGAGTTR